MANELKPFGTVTSAWNTRPAAPVEGLETVETQRYVRSGDFWVLIQPRNAAGYMAKGTPVRELVARPQAEAIIAAERERANNFQAELWGCEIDLNAAKADNAALTARVKELEKDVAKREEHRGKLMKGYRGLETQLAAANKDLDRAVEWRDHDKDRAERYRKALERIAARNGIPMAGSFAAEVARAALEAQP